MQATSVETIIRALNGAGARYMIAGGLAVVAHGFLRFTADIDIVLAFDDENLGRALPALSKLGYQPRAPVPMQDFIDPAKRAVWVKEKGMRVFSLFSSAHPATEIDVFVEPPFDFDAAYAAALRQELCPGVEAVFVGLDDLLRMKRDAGRPKDLQDIGELESLRKDLGDV
ncbi:MAG: hypothetical protein WC728_05475 [Elusimicrobiota bacterium]